MIDRLDMSYWPPRPTDQPSAKNSQHLDSERLTNDMLYIDDDERRQSVYANDEWADIFEFWAASCTEPQRFDGSGRVIGTRHLTTASSTFHRIAYELAYQDQIANEWNADLTRVIDTAYVAPNDNRTRAERFLFHHVLSAYDRRFDRRKLLISRSAINAAHNNELELEGIGKEGALVIAKVALRWEKIDEEAARLITDKQLPDDPPLRHS